MYDTTATTPGAPTGSTPGAAPGAPACTHTPPCPAADSPDHEAARTISRRPEQGWNLLCNGVVLFDDTGELLPSGQTVDPHRPACHWRPAA